MSIFILKLFQQSHSKMKLSLVFLAVLGVATAASIPSRQVATKTTKSLSDDLNDFLSLFEENAHEFIEIFIRYLSEDAEFQAGLVYISGDEFKGLVTEVGNLPEYIDFLDYLYYAGLDAYKWVNLLHGLLGLDALPTPTRLASTRTGGIAGLVDEILALIPRDEIRALHEEKLQTSPEYAELVAHLASPEFQTIVTAVKGNAAYQELISKLESVGVPAEKIIDLCYELIGLSRP